MPAHCEVVMATTGDGGSEVERAQTYRETERMTMESERERERERERKKERERQK